MKQVAFIQSTLVVCYRARGYIEQMNAFLLYNTIQYSTAGGSFNDSVIVVLYT